MRGSLILRLVDITLLLLLTLMAIATLRPADVELPLSHHMKDKGKVVAPAKIVITQNGLFQRKEEAAVTLADLPDILPASNIPVEFMADHRAPAQLLQEANRIAQSAGLRSVFLVIHGREP